MRRYSWRWLLTNERGGGSKPQPAQIIPAPTPPDVKETSRESLEAQLWANPQLVAQQVALQQQYGLPLAQSQADIQAQIAPQLARSQFGILSEQAPLFRALLEQQYPALGPFSQQVTERMISPQGLTAQQQAAQDAIRQRSREQVSRNIRNEANLGGGLFGGRRELREDRSLGELEQGFAAQDIQLQDTRRAQAIQELLSLFQLAGLPVQQFNAPQPTVPGFGQSPVPGGDVLYNALVQNAGNFGIIDPMAGTPGAGAGLMQGLGTGMGAAGMAAAIAM